MKDKKLKQELPGHADEVFALDWAPDGSRVASGGKDKIVKLLVIKKHCLWPTLIFFFCIPDGPINPNRLKKKRNI